MWLWGDNMPMIQLLGSGGGGAIIDSGPNYVHFEDETLIVWDKLTMPDVPATYLEYSYPKVFHGNPTVLLTPYDDAFDKYLLISGHVINASSAATDVTLKGLDAFGNVSVANGMLFNITIIGKAPLYPIITV